MVAELFEENPVDTSGLKARDRDPQQTKRRAVPTSRRRAPRLA
jgi:hypothetical protein